MSECTRQQYVNNSKRELIKRYLLILLAELEKTPTPETRQLSTEEMLASVYARIEKMPKKDRAKTREVVRREIRVPKLYKGKVQ